MLAAELYRAASEAQGRAEKFNDYQKTFDDPKKRQRLIKGGNGSMEYLGVIDSLRNTYRLSERQAGNESAQQFADRRIREAIASGMIPFKSP